MKACTRRDHGERFNRVLVHMSAHLQEGLTLERLSRVAAMSKFHFHRRFREHTGLPPEELAQRMRLKRASYELVFGRRRLLDIALDAQFGSPEAFARAFKRIHGQSPRDFRRNPDWLGWSRHYVYPQPIHRAPLQIDVVELPEMRVATIEHNGGAQELNRTVRSFLDWRDQVGLPSDGSSPTYGIPQSPNRFSLCRSVRHDVIANPQGVRTTTLPAGRFARTVHVGSLDTLADTLFRMRVEWLAASGERARPEPPRFHYLTVMPTVAEHAQRTAVLQPLM